MPELKNGISAILFAFRFELKIKTKNKRLNKKFDFKRG